MTQSILNSIKVEVPDYSTQKRVGKILNDIDNQINVNNYTNDNLEKQGSLLIDNYLEKCNNEVELSDLLDFVNGFVFSYD